MKKKIKKTYKYNKIIYSSSQIMILVFALLLFGLMMLGISINRQDFSKLLETDLIFNIVFLLSMFSIICFFELYYFRKKFNSNTHIEIALLNVLLIGIVELFLLNIPIAGLLIYFVYNFIKQNNLKLSKLFLIIRNNGEIKILIFNFIMFVLVIILVYTMVQYRFIIS